MRIGYSQYIDMHLFRVQVHVDSFGAYLRILVYLVLQAQNLLTIRLNGIPQLYKSWAYCKKLLNDFDQLFFICATYSDMSQERVS